MEQADPNSTNKDGSDLIPPGCGLFFAWLAACTAATALGWVLGWRLSFMLNVVGELGGRKCNFGDYH